MLLPWSLYENVRTANAAFSLATFPGTGRKKQLLLHYNEHHHPPPPYFELVANLISFGIQCVVIPSV